MTARIIIFAAALAAPAAADVPVNCSSLDAIQAGLASGYGETVAAYGLSGEGAETSLMVITTNPDTGSWTVIEAMPDGTACVRGAGEGFTEVEAKKGAPS